MLVIFLWHNSIVYINGVIFAEKANNSDVIGLVHYSNKFYALIP